MQTPHFLSLPPVLALGLCAVFGGNISAQSTPLVYKVAGAQDDINAAAAGQFPGLQHGSRQQFFITSGRLTGLVGKQIKGIQFRRDPSSTDAMTGGDVDLTVQAFTVSNLPFAVSESFATNAAASNLTMVFQGRQTIPNSPAMGTNPDLWSANNSFTLTFSTPFTYQGGTLGLDISGMPVSQTGTPTWELDCEHIPSTGKTEIFGQSCSHYTAEFQNKNLGIYMSNTGLAIGGRIQTLFFAHPQSSVLAILGVQQLTTPADLSVMGALNCKQYTDVALSFGLPVYSMPKSKVGTASFAGRIPPQSTLVGAKFYMQSAEIQAAVPLAERTNAVGLTTSQGLEIQIGGKIPELGMSILESAPTKQGQSFPTTGSLNIENAPVMRLLYN